MKRNGRMRRFKVIVEHDPEAATPYKYGAWVPSLPGCQTDGRTRDEALENIKEAIKLYLEARAAVRRRRRETAFIQVRT